MTPPSNTTTVAPEWDRGSLLLKFGAPSPFGEAQLEFAGDGVLSFDPAAPDRLLALTVSEPDMAPATLVAALGPEGVRQLDAMRGAADLMGAITVVPTSPLGPLARVALVSWLDQWSPLDVPRQASAVDVGLAAHQAQHSLLALRSFAMSADYLVALTDRMLARRDPPPGPVLIALRDTVSAARDALGSEHGLSDDLGQAEGRLSAALSAEAADLVVRLQELIDQSLGAAKVLGSAAAAEVDADVGGVFTVDWAMVPARVLSPAEGAGRMSATETAVVVTVEAARYVDPRRLLGLNARLVHAQTGEVLAVAPLLRDDSGLRFVAQFPYSRARTTPEVLRSASPEVYSESTDGAAPSPRIGESQARSVAWQRAVTALTHLRRFRAAEAALGGPLPAELEAARRLSSSAERLVKGITTSESTAAELRDWRLSLSGGQPSGKWPRGLEVPDGIGIGRPTLAEMIEVWDPSLFEVARP